MVAELLTLVYVATALFLATQGLFEEARTNLQNTKRPTSALLLLVSYAAVPVVLLVRILKECFQPVKVAAQVWQWTRPLLDVAERCAFAVFLAFESWTHAVWTRVESAFERALISVWTHVVTFAVAVWARVESAFASAWSWAAQAAHAVCRWWFVQAVAVCSVVWQTASWALFKLWTGVFKPVARCVMHSAYQAWTGVFKPVARCVMHSAYQVWMDVVKPVARSVCATADAATRRVGRFVWEPLRQSAVGATEALRLAVHSVLEGAGRACATANEVIAKATASIIGS